MGLTTVLGKVLIFGGDDGKCLSVSCCCGAMLWPRTRTRAVSLQVDREETGPNIIRLLSHAASADRTVAS
eukprot:3812229-Rhodomonas_salina.5